MTPKEIIRIGKRGPTQHVFYGFTVSVGDDGSVSLSDVGGWLPGSYESVEAAVAAFNGLDYEGMNDLQKEAIAAGGSRTVSLARVHAKVGATRPVSYDSPETEAVAVNVLGARLKGEMEKFVRLAGGTKPVNEQAVIAVHQMSQGLEARAKRQRIEDSYAPPAALGA